MFDANLDLNNRLAGGPPLKMPKAVVPIPRISPKTTPQTAPLGSTRPQKLGVKDINFSKTWKVKSGINDSGFRNRVNQGLKGTLKSYADRKTVADILWNARG